MKSAAPSVRSPGSSRPQLAHGSAAYDIDRTNPYASPLAHRSVVSVAHPVVAARKEQQSAMATRLYKEHLRREQDELAEAIERSLDGEAMTDAFVIHGDEGMPRRLD